MKMLKRCTLLMTLVEKQSFRSRVSCSGSCPRCAGHYGGIGDDVVEFAVQNG
jgi:hypothetical protein